MQKLDGKRPFKPFNTFKQFKPSDRRRNRWLILNPKPGSLSLNLSF